MYHNRKTSTTQVVYDTYKMTLHPTFVEEMTIRVAEVVNEWLRVPITYTEGLQEEFKPILNGEARQRAMTFISEEHTFYEGVKEVSYYKDFIHRISELPKNLFFGRVYFNNDDIISELQIRIEAIKSILINHLIQRYQDYNQKILDGFQGIEDKLLKEPENTTELMALIEYIDDTRGELLAHLREDIIEGHKQEFALLDVYILSQTDMQMLLQVQAWNKKINGAFEKCAIVSAHFHPKIVEPYSIGITFLL